MNTEKIFKLKRRLLPCCEQALTLQLSEIKSEIIKILENIDNHNSECSKGDEE